MRYKITIPAPSAARLGAVRGLVITADGGWGDGRSWYFDIPPYVTEFEFDFDGELVLNPEAMDAPFHSCSVHYRNAARTSEESTIVVPARVSKE